MACVRGSSILLRKIRRPQQFTATLTQAASGPTNTTANQPPPPSVPTDDNKSYQAQEYYQYNEFSFYDMECHMKPKRDTQPQPSSLEPLVPAPAPPKK